MCPLVQSRRPSPRLSEGGGFYIVRHCLTLCSMGRLHSSRRQARRIARLTMPRREKLNFFSFPPCNPMGNVIYYAASRTKRTKKGLDDETQHLQDDARTESTAHCRCLPEPDAPRTLSQDGEGLEVATRQDGACHNRGYLRRCRLCRHRIRLSGGDTLTRKEHELWKFLLALPISP